MSRYDVKVVMTSEFTFAVEAEDPLSAQQDVLGTMSQEEQTPESVEMTFSVQKGVS